MRTIEDVIRYLENRVEALTHVIEECEKEGSRAAAEVFHWKRHTINQVLSYAKGE